MWRTSGTVLLDQVRAIEEIQPSVRPARWSGRTLARQGDDAAVKVDSAFHTDGGPHRRRNEDYALAEAENGLFVVADGLGGAAAGDRASQVATKSLASFLTCTDPPLLALDSQVSDRLTRTALRALAPPEYERAIPNERLRMAFLVAHCRVLEEGRNLGCIGMATAMIAAWQTSDAWWVGHVGDCRAYTLSDDTLTLLTKDHSLSAALAGRDSLPQSIEDSPFLRSRLTQVVGGESLPNPDVQEYRPQPGDRLMLCSDGVWGALSDEEMAGELAADAPAAQIAKALVDQAIESGSRDNATTLVIKF